MADYDVVVIGAGMAGLTAGMTAARYGLHVIIVDQMGVGGQIINTEKVENMPGFPDGVAGFDIGPIVQMQADAAGAEFAIDTVESLETGADEHIVHGADQDYSTRVVIIANGSSFRTLGVPGEEKFIGHGISNCASCDGPFYSGATVAVIGGGDSALEEAEVLTKHVDRVLVFHNGEAPIAQQSIATALADKPSVEIFDGCEVEEILGEDNVTGLRIRDLTSGSTREEAVAGVFVFVGLQPNSAYLDGVVDLDSGGHITVDLMMRTSVQGIFAAGDIRAGSVSLLPSVMGDGATAAVAAYRYVRGL